MKVTIDRTKKKVTIELDLLEVPAVHPNTTAIAEVRNQEAGIAHDNGKGLKVSATVYFKQDQPPK